MTKDKENEQSLSDFLLNSPLKDSDIDLSRSKLLSDRDRDIFLAMLNADDEPNEKLIDAFKARKELISE